MRKLFFLIFSLMILSCSKLLNEPKNLIPKDKMTEILADLAVSDQLGYLGMSGNMEIQTRFILNKYNVKGTQFTESYKYYLSTGDLQGIYDDAQKIIIKKDPEAEKYIEKKKKENKTNNIVK